MPNLPHLNTLSEKATREYLDRSSIGFLECAVNLMMTHMSVARVIEILQAQIRMLKEYE